MANTKVILKKSGVSGNTPGSLQYGELALNYADGVLYYKDATGNLKSFVESTKGDESLSTTSSDQVVDTFSKTYYRTVKYLVQAIQGSNVHCTEVVMTHDDTDVYKNEYGTFYTDNSLITVSATIDSSNVSLVVTPTYTNTTIDFVRTSLIARTLV
jgi:hypothetical protein